MKQTQQLKGALKALIGMAGVSLCMSCAWAHKASDAYMHVTDASTSEQKADGGGDRQVAVQLSLALKDVDAALETLDADGDRRITWGEIRQASKAISQWAGSGIQWTCGASPLAPTWRYEALEQRTDGRYVRLGTTLACSPPQTLDLDYRLMRGIDPTHRLLVSGRLGQRDVAAVLAPDGRSSTALRTAAPRSGAMTLVQFISAGVHHILEGYDHLAFLLALLLPISLSRQTRSEVAPHPTTQARSQWHGLHALLQTVTSFTIGHSITLALAGWGWLSVSAAWVEPAIALSIGTSALLNLYPVSGLNPRLLALGFGLIHGLGFSSALTEAGVARDLLVWALAGFNLGVEIGQIMVLTLWCAACLALSRWSRYRLVVVKGGSMALFALSLYWTFQRLALT